MKRYTARGLVWGYLWGGGKGCYPSKPLNGKSEREIKEKATRMLGDGSLDAGMGFQSLYAATLTLQVDDVKKVSKNEYVHTSYKHMFLGKPSSEEIEYFTRSTHYSI